MTDGLTSPEESPRQVKILPKPEAGPNTAIDRLLENFESGFGTCPDDEKPIYADLLRVCFLKGNPWQIYEAHKLLLGTLDHPKNNFQPYVESIVFQLINHPTKTLLRLEGDRLLDDILVKYGLDPVKTKLAWVSSIYNGEEPIRNKRYEENFATLLALEKTRPGIGKFLNEEYDIYDFARYPSEMLIAQYDEKDNVDLPYGIILYPRDDHNGAFYETTPALEKLYKDFKGKYAVRVAECKSKGKIARALIKLDQRYGQYHKISFAVVAGHGLPDSIQFGDSRLQSDFINKGEVRERERIRRAKDFFVDNPKIVLISCSTGVKEGIGQELSGLGSTVVAPEKPTNIESFKVEFGKDGSLSRLEPVYREGKTVKYTAGKPHGFWKR